MRKRKPLTRGQLRLLLKRQAGKCSVKDCGVVLIVGPKCQHVNFIDEHEIPRGLGGSEALKNRSLRCLDHARGKTNRPKSGGIGGDLFEIKKTGRMKRKHKIDKPPLERAKPKTRTYRWVSRPLKSAKRPWPKRKMSNAAAKHQQH
jgi:hypothetical protein